LAMNIRSTFAGFDPVKGGVNQCLHVDIYSQEREFDGEALHLNGCTLHCLLPKSADKCTGCRTSQNRTLAIKENDIPSRLQKGRLAVGNNATTEVGILLLGKKELANDAIK